MAHGQFPPSDPRRQDQVPRGLQEGHGLQRYPALRPHRDLRVAVRDVQRLVHGDLKREGREKSGVGGECGVTPQNWVTLDEPTKLGDPGRIVC